MKIVVIGAQIAGATFAVNYKKEHPEDDVIIINKNIHTSYITSALPILLKEDIKDDDIILYSEKYLKSLGIKLYLKSEVISVEPDTKTLKIIKGASGTLETLDYDKLIIASGCNSVKLPIFENKGNNFFIFKNILNINRLKKFIEKNEPKNALIVGGGGTGITVATALNKLNIDITIVEKEKNILRQFDTDFQIYAKEYLEKNNIKLLLDSEIKAAEQGNKVKVKINKEDYEYDFIVVTAGIIPNTNYLHNTNIHMTQNGYIFVNEKLETNIKDIYAIGDCAIVKSSGVEEYILPKLAGAAKLQAEYLYRNIDSNKTYKGTTAPMVINVLDKVLAKIGIIESQAEENNLEYKIIEIKENIYPNYINENKEIYLKAIFNKNLDFIGIEMFGDEEIISILNYFTSALKGKFNAKDFIEQEFYYTPKYFKINEIIKEIGEEALKENE